MLAKHLGDKELVPRTYKELSQLINGGGGAFFKLAKDFNRHVTKGDTQIAKIT